MLYRYLVKSQILAAHFAKRNTKFGGGGKARAGREFLFPPTPFPSRPARASVSVLPRSAASVSFVQKRFAHFQTKCTKLDFTIFCEAETEVCSPRLRGAARKELGGKIKRRDKIPRTIFSEMRRFVITKLCIKINFYSNFLRKISRFAGLRRFFIPSPNISHAKI